MVAPPATVEMETKVRQIKIGRREIEDLAGLELRHASQARRFVDNLARKYLGLRPETHEVIFDFNFLPMSQQFLEGLCEALYDRYHSDARQLFKFLQPASDADQRHLLERIAKNEGFNVTPQEITPDSMYTHNGK